MVNLFLDVMRVAFDKRAGFIRRNAVIEESTSNGVRRDDRFRERLVEVAGVLHPGQLCEFASHGVMFACRIGVGVWLLDNLWHSFLLAVVQLADPASHK